MIEAYLITYKIIRQQILKFRNTHLIIYPIYLIPKNTINFIHQNIELIIDLLL